MSPFFRLSSRARQFSQACKDRCEIEIEIEIGDYVGDITEANLIEHIRDRQLQEGEERLVSGTLESFGILGHFSE